MNRAGFMGEDGYLVFYALDPPYPARMWDQPKWMIEKFGYFPFYFTIRNLNFVTTNFVTTR
jgi:hypothetical protein